MNLQSKPVISHSPIRVIAITGCDGSGKSTLATSLVSYLSTKGEVELLYLGQSSGRIGEWISSLPLIGPAFGRYLLAKSAGVHDRSSTPQGNITTLVIYLLSCWRAYKFRRMLAKCKKGTLLVTDRYPQAEIPGFRFDGPQLAKAQGGNFWVRALRQREQKLYNWMASFPPILLIRLDIDAETAHSRKPDHSITALREKIAVIPHLTFNGANILDLDGRQPAGQIFDESLSAIRSSLSHSQV